MKPSQDEIYITGRLREACEPVGVELVDKLASGRAKDWCSMAAGKVLCRGMMEAPTPARE